MIPVNQPLLDGNEKKYLEECIATGWISSEGPFVTRFEQGMAQVAQRRHGIAVCNGTVALEAAVAALGLEPGSQILMPTFTIISCAAAVVRAGCEPLLVDCDARTWNLDVDALRARIVDEIERKGNRRLRAIMVVHIYGLPVDMDPVLELAARYDLRVIEDAAEMHGQTYRDRPCGSFGDIGVFSFYPNKHVTTGEGGMIVTDDDRLADRCRALRNLCFVPERRFVHEELGWNFRMTNLQAAVGVAQLERLPEFVARKRRMGALYQDLLGDVPGLELPPARASYAESIYWVFGVVLADEVPGDAADLMRRLGKRGIGTRPFFWPMHEQPVFQRRNLFVGERYPVAERLARRGFYVPSGLALTDEQIAEVAAGVRAELEARC